MNFKYNNMELDIVNEFKYLGVRIDSMLKFEKQYIHILSKLKFFLACMTNLSKFLNEYALTKIYVGFILPYIEYSLDSYALFNMKHLKTLSKLNKRIVKLTTLNCESYSIFYRLKYKYLKRLFNIIDKKTPDSISSLLFSSHKRITRRNVILPIVNISKFKFSFSFTIKSLYIKLHDIHGSDQIRKCSMESLIQTLPDDIMNFFYSYLQYIFLLTYICLIQFFFF